MYVGDIGRRDSVVSIVSRLWAGRGKRYFSFPKSLDWLSRAHLVSFSVFTMVVSWRYSGWGVTLTCHHPPTLRLRMSVSMFGSISSHAFSHIRYLINDTNEMHTWSLRIYTMFLLKVLVCFTPSSWRAYIFLTQNHLLFIQLSSVCQQWLHHEIYRIKEKVLFDLN